MTHVMAFCALFAFCLIYSLAKGGNPEKAAMLLQGAAIVLAIGAIRFFPSTASFHGFAAGIMAIDTVLFFSLAALALRANRLWTIVLAGLQLSTVLIHVSKALFPALPAASYGIFAQFWAWPMLITSAVGTFQHAARIRRLGQEQDWKPLWPHLVRTGSTA